MLTTHQFRTQLKELTMTDNPGPGPIHDGDDVEAHKFSHRADAEMTDADDDVQGHINRPGREAAEMSDADDDVEGHRIHFKP